MTKSKQDPIKKHEEYMAFLKKRLESKNFKANVSKEEFDLTKYKYDKAKLVYRLMKGAK